MKETTSHINHRKEMTKSPKKIRLAFALLAVTLIFAGCSKLRPLPENLAEEKSSAKKSDPKVVYRFFDDDYTPGGYDYVYPDASRIFIPEESGHESEVALQFDLIADDYSGGSVCLYNLLYNVKPYLASGAMQFWIKGNLGGEVAWVALVDEENTDGKKTVVRLPINNYGGITKDWTLIKVPLADFGRRGVYWNPKKRIEVPYRFDWEKVAEFRIEIKKADNPAFRVWVDDVFIMRDQFEPRKDIYKEEKYWDEIEETVPAPPLAEAPKVDIKHMIFKDAYDGGFTYVYGGKTANRIQPTSDKKNQGVLAMYQDVREYSGVTLARGQGRNLDLSEQRKTKAGLAFWLKAAPGVSKIYIGLLDDESDGNKIQTKVALSDFGQVDTTWRYYMVPIKKFMDKGLYWDAAKKAEIGGPVDWTKINEFRFSTSRYENKVPSDDQPVAFYADEISIIEEIPGWVDPDEYWANFQSDAKDILLHNFETKADQQWEVAHGPKSKINFSIIKPKGANKSKAALEIDYHLGDWCDAMFDFKIQKSSKKKRDWTKHWGLKFDFYTDKPYQGVTLQISDEGDELFVANAGGPRGWTQVIVPFRAFNKFPYYQPPQAVQNGLFDLNNVIKIDFKPAGEGSKGKFAIDNIYLTNQREVKEGPVKEKTPVTLTANWKKTLTKSINPGIYGINVALWDGDLLRPNTDTYVKAVNHSVLRYPGGLRADEDHWEEVLNKKDWMVDTDEFMEFAEKTNNEAMITVNFGMGTPEEAAKWVKHLNVDNQKKVVLWEVGNELYGDWHANHCSAEEYGKRSVEFIKAMKAVDPTIKVAVVWVLEGEWNRIVFEHTKELADAVIIHHYPQHAGEENDYALLAAPSTLDNIIPSVKEQMKNWGVSGKHYEIWLTEWNSVDFKPGPQTLGMTNALFVADYLGKLAEHNIEQADYWDVHNNLTPEGGDYGYLSRTGDPIGDNKPRPSYFAFKMVANAIHGRLADCGTNDDNVNCYAAEKDGRKNVLIINKHKKTKAVTTLRGLRGGAQMQQLVKDNGWTGYDETRANIKGGKITLPPYSITILSY